MKELSIEEKVKRYDEVVAMAKECITYVPDDTVNKYMLNMFPELKESEGENTDEKVRKALIKLVTNHASMDLFIEYDIHLDEALSWLEKQGEQKPADKVEPKFKVGDKIRKKTPSSFDRDMQVARIEKDYYVCNHIGKFSSEVVPFSKQSRYELIEQNPAWSEECKQYLKIEGYENLSDYEKIFDDIADKYVRNKNQKGYNQSWYVKERAAEMLYQANKELKKKASWSEEDEDIRDNIIRDLKRLSGDMVSKNQTYQKEIQWLNSLKERVLPKREWSKEDETMLGEIIDFFENGTVKLQHDLSLYASWLKSLRPQTTWKPSEEQMKALNTCIIQGEISYVGQGTELQSLYNDLKKLAE